MSGPPDKWSGFSTAGLDSIQEFVDKLTYLGSQGFTGPVVAVPDPNSRASEEHWWVAVGGYTK